MSGLEQLEASNPVPGIRGNPGAVGEQQRRRSRVGKALAVIAALVVVILAGSALVRSQTSQSNEFTAAVDRDPTIAADDTSVTSGEAEPSRSIVRQELFATLLVPTIDLSVTALQGVDTAILRAGPGHYVDTAVPGQSGNAAFAGHRETFGSPFGRIDELAAGDSVFVTTLQGLFEYQVVETKEVLPEDVSVLADFGDNRLTLTTSIATTADEQRLVVVAELVGDPVEASAFTALPRAARISEQQRAEAPDIDAATLGDRSRYTKYSGNTRALATAQSFVLSQFPSWQTSQIDFAVHAQTLQSALVRWSDTTTGTNGWIVLVFVDGRYEAVEMTMDGVRAGMAGTPVRAFGWVSSDRDVTAQVLAPIPAWMLPGKSIEPLRTKGDVVLLEQQVVAGESVPLRIDGIVDDFEEIRFVIRNESGAQIGGIASSMRLRSEQSVELVTHVDQIDDLHQFLADNANMASSWFTLDRFQSAGLLQESLPGYGPQTVAELPSHLVTRVELLRFADDIEGHQEFVAETLVRFNVGPEPSDLQPSDLRSGALAGGATPPASGYVIDQLPGAGVCGELWSFESAKLAFNDEGPTAAPTPLLAVLESRLVTTPLIEFTNVDGTVLGFAQAVEGQHFTFAHVVSVVQVDDGWVVDRWESRRCN